MAGALAVGGIGGGLLWYLPVFHRPGRVTAHRMFDMRDRRDARCRGGCAATTAIPMPDLSILPTGPTAGQIAAGSLTAATGQTVNVARASPRFCTKADGTLASLSNNQICVESGGISIEPAATNLLLHSTEPYDSWGSAGVTVTKDGCAGPDGTMTGTKLDVPDTASGSPTDVTYQSVSIGAHSGTDPWAGSVYVKLLSGSPTKLCMTETPDGIETDSACVTPTGGWQRIVDVFVPTLASSNSWVTEIGVDRRDPAVTGQPAFSECIWGAQLESVGTSAATATSVIATVGAAVTRPAEVVTVSGLSLAPGVCMSATVEAFPDNASTDRAILDLDDGTYVDALTLSLEGRTNLKIQGQAGDDLGSDPTALESSAHAYAAGQKFSVCESSAMALTLYRDGSTVSAAMSGTPGAYSAVPGTLTIGTLYGDTASVTPMTLQNICVGAHHSDCP
jgi:hypothetical protein